MEFEKKKKMFVVYLGNLTTNIRIWKGINPDIKGLWYWPKSSHGEIRERDWCNVVTCHVDTPQAYVWRLQNFVLGEHILTPSAEIEAPVKSCTISACANFAILGTAGGWVERFNLQSGMSRGSYVDLSKGRHCAHDAEVVGVACDSTNSVLISVGYHGDIKVWDFKGLQLKSKLEIGSPASILAYHRPNGNFFPSYLLYITGFGRGLILTLKAQS